MSVKIKSASHISLDKNLVALARKLHDPCTLEIRAKLLREQKNTKDYLSEENPLQKVLDTCSLKEKIVLYSILAIGQGEHFFDKGRALRRQELEPLFSSLIPVEEFYQHIGGLVGYHVLCLQLQAKKNTEKKRGALHPPKALDISEETSFVRESILAGIEHLDDLAEVYPLGGAADRLSLRDEETGDLYTAAPLAFCGKSLLERLIDDVVAREYLHFKLFGKRVRIPIAMMTSSEKNNDAHVRQMLEKKRWFGRRKQDFFVFSQPLVPAMNKKGRWCMTGRLCPLMKPGGHGVIWKLGRDKGVWDWLKDKKKKKVLMRQINNVIGGNDYGILAFTGIGFRDDKDFGFASCPRMIGASEGVNVVVEEEKGCYLSNIEYCDFSDSFSKDGIPFLANTNLLFADIGMIEKQVPILPIPGMLVNAKNIQYKRPSGEMIEEEVLRLESTMQNISDGLIESSKELKRCYITSHKRKKTISTIKKEFDANSTLMQTPEQAYLDFLDNAHDLLSNFCEFLIPELKDPLEFFLFGPSFTFFYHPSLGPLYSIIGQKLHRGRLAMGSELLLEISEIQSEDLDIDGSLHILTEGIVGHTDENGEVHYSHQTGKCTLKGVRVRNSGINRGATRSFWKNSVVYKERCEIFIEEGGEFYAENVVLRGDLRIRIPSGVKVTASMDKRRLCLTEEVLSKPSWWWEYSINDQKQIELRKH